MKLTSLQGSLSVRPLSHRVKLVLHVVSVGEVYGLH